MSELSDGQQWYREVYLKSDYWKKTRIELLDYFHWVCQDCNGKACQIHHVKYRTDDGRPVLHNELTYKGCVVALCDWCHHERHKPTMRKIESDLEKWLGEW